MSEGDGFGERDAPAVYLKNRLDEGYRVYHQFNVDLFREDFLVVHKDNPVVGVGFSLPAPMQISDLDCEILWQLKRAIARRLSGKRANNPVLTRLKTIKVAPHD